MCPEAFLFDIVIARLFLIPASYLVRFQYDGGNQSELLRRTLGGAPGFGFKVGGRPFAPARGGPASVGFPRYSPDVRE